jgi:hypothetical protein
MLIGVREVLQRCKKESGRQAKGGRVTYQKQRGCLINLQFSCVRAHSGSRNFRVLDFLVADS